MRENISKEELEGILKSSFSMADVVSKCGSNARGNSYLTVLKLIKIHEINKAAYPYLVNNKNRVALDKKIIIRKASGFYNLESLKENTYISSSSLRRLLKMADISEKCSECGIANTYNNKPVKLEIDHINGNKYDNRLINLRFLCPNCHSQTSTFGKKNKFDYSIYDQSTFDRSLKEPARVFYEIECNACNGKFINNIHAPKYCSVTCAKIGSRKCLLSAQEIFDLFQQTNYNFSKLSKQLGISDVAIRKRLRKAGLL